MSQFTSTMIDDEDLIEELRKYGETNLPTLPSSTTTTITSRRSRAAASNELNDTNREIYLKKLNHYRAKEKAKLNPSKQYKKQQQATAYTEANNAKAKQAPVQKPSAATNDLNDIYDDDEEVVEINSPQNANETTSEYIRVNNAYTSPMSNGTINVTQNDYDDYNGRNHQFNHRSPVNNNQNDYSVPVPPQTTKLDYVKLKERIELDKTLSKYRSEINNIISSSKVSRTQSNNFAKTEPPNYDPDVIYTKTVHQNGGYRDTGAEQSMTQTLYCPKPVSNAKSKTFMETIKARLTPGRYNNSGSNLQPSASTLLNQIRGGGQIKRPGVETDPNSTYLTPKKETPSDSKFSKFVALISNVGLQISKILPYIVFVIFTVIILQYVRMKFYSNVSHKFNSFDSSSTNEQQQKHHSSVPPVLYEEYSFCSDVKDTRCSQTKLLAKELIDYLRYVSGKVDCSPLAMEQKSSSTSYLSAEFLEKCVHLNTIIAYLTHDRGLIPSTNIQTEAIDSVLNAIIRNPHWDVRLLNGNYSDTTVLSQVTYLISGSSYKPMMCRIKELIHFLYVRAVMLVTACFALLIAYLGYKTLKNHRTEKERAFFQLVSRATSDVEKQYELSLLDPQNVKPYVAIAHIYASMFEPSQRAKSRKLWQKVTKFIEDHESRIHVETQFIDGEETQVWKWVAPKTVPTVAAGKHVIGLANSTTINQDGGGQSHGINKENNVGAKDDQNEPNLNVVGWQGDAFNRSDKLLHSPTSCLKVRNMFDGNTIETDPFFQVKIHNDILEKCCTQETNFGGKKTKKMINTTILHIACDKKSKEGCVYIKCSSNEAAGKAYQALNATWYNGKLLNVKFLREDRYLDRYPDSINCSVPLQLL